MARSWSCEKRPLEYFVAVYAVSLCGCYAVSFCGCYAVSFCEYVKKWKGKSLPWRVTRVFSSHARTPGGLRDLTVPYQ